MHSQQSSSIHRVPRAGTPIKMIIFGEEHVFRITEVGHEGRGTEIHYIKDSIAVGNSRAVLFVGVQIAPPRTKSEMGYAIEIPHNRGQAAQHDLGQSGSDVACLVSQVNWGSPSASAFTKS